MTSNRYIDGRKGTKLYDVWMSMRARCYLASDSNYVRYGAKGVRVCDEWRQSFPVFREWALANGYGPGLMIDRIDSAGHYEPANCRWATRTQQNRNRSINTILTVFGESKTMADWAEDPRCVVSYGALQQRVFRGWPHELAVSAPKGTRR